MATTTNGNGNLVDEFEEAFQACLHVITKDGLANMDRDAVRTEAEQTVSRMMDIARQLEAFFLQKRFLLSALKPELIIKEDCSNLQHELARKDELIKRHHEKISVWLSLMAEMQSPQQPRTLPQGQPGAGGPQQGPNMGQPNGSIHGPGGPGVPSGPGLQGVPGMQGMPSGQGMPALPGPNMVQQQQLHQQMQMHQMQLQQMQQMQMQQQVAGMGGGMVSPQQAMMMQQQGMGMPQGMPQGMSQGMGMPPRGPSFPNQGPGGVLQGPLAFLEKTTSNIGMPDGRR